MKQKSALLALLVLAVLSLTAVAAVAAPRQAAKPDTIRVDVAENGLRFIFDDAPVFAEDGMPAYGNSFVTEGYLYPPGTLSCDDEGCNGILDNGEPEFPDLVIGTWSCRGFFVGDGGHTVTGPMVVTTQMYELNGDYIVTDGFELADIGVAAKRSITGGTGPYGQARGEMQQILLGFNQHMGVALQVELNVAK